MMDVIDIDELNNKNNTGGKYMNNNSKFYWTIHAVLNDDGTTNIHTHGLENYKLTNLEWICPSQDEDWISWGGNMLNHIAKVQIEEGNEYKCGAGHLIDDANNFDDVSEIFYLEDTIDEYGDHVHEVWCDFWYIYSHPDTGKLFCFDMDKKRWILAFEE